MDSKPLRRLGEREHSFTAMSLFFMADTVLARIERTSAPNPFCRAQKY
jgi:hypothetical protein